MSILIIAEHNNKVLSPATLSVLTAANQLGGDITVLVAGAECTDVASQISKCAGVFKVLLCEDACLEHGLAESLAELVSAQAVGFSYILAPATTFGKNVMPRVAALLKVAQVSDIIGIENADTFVRPIYAGNALATVRSKDTQKVITVRPTAFEKASDQGGSGTVEKITHSFTNKGFSSFVSRAESKSDRPELANARIVVSGGRGLQNKENFSLVYDLADALGAGVGASRAAVDAGYVPNDYQVGQTGKVVAPELYIAVGISGAIQHLAGMKESKVIVAINKDPDAPIFQIADYGLVGDLFGLIPQLTQSVKECRKAQAS